MGADLEGCGAVNQGPRVTRTVEMDSPREPPKGSGSAHTSLYSRETCFVHLTSRTEREGICVVF